MNILRVAFPFSFFPRAKATSIQRLEPLTLPNRNPFTRKSTFNSKITASKCDHTLTTMRPAQSRYITKKDQVRNTYGITDTAKGEEI